MSLAGVAISQSVQGLEPRDGSASDTGRAVLARSARGTRFLLPAFLRCGHDMQVVATSVEQILSVLIVLDGVEAGRDERKWSASP
jgi:hypothetical protein